MTTNTKNDVQAQKPKLELIRKFELAIYNEDVDAEGKPKYKQVSFERPIIVEATSPQDLKDKLALYKETGQVAKVVREIDPPSKEQIEAFIAQQKGEVASKQQVQVNAQKVQAEHNEDNGYVEEPKIIQTVKSKPKYYKVGDIEIKDDNGKIYQKQWMKLSDSEAANIRVINDKNNALVNLNGKHLEMKRWILVETSDSDGCSQLEENLK